MSNMTPEQYAFMQQQYAQQPQYAQPPTFSGTASNSTLSYPAQPQYAPQPTQQPTPMQPQYAPPAMHQQPAQQYQFASVAALTSSADALRQYTQHLESSMTGIGGHPYQVKQDTVGNWVMMNPDTQGKWVTAHTTPFTNGAGQQVPALPINIVAVAAIPDLSKWQRAFWVGKDKDAKLLCSSNNGLTAERSVAQLQTPDGICVTCPKSQKGSGGNGAASACAKHLWIAVQLPLQNGDNNLYALKLNVNSTAGMPNEPKYPELQHQTFQPYIEQLQTLGGSLFAATTFVNLAAPGGGYRRFSAISVLPTSIHDPSQTAMLIAQAEKFLVVDPVEYNLAPPALPQGNPQMPQMPPQGYAPQGGVPQMPQGNPQMMPQMPQMPPQGYAPQGGVPQMPQGNPQMMPQMPQMPPQGYAPQGGVPQMPQGNPQMMPQMPQMPPQGYAPQGGVPQGGMPQGYAPQMPQGGMPPQGAMPPQGYAPPMMPTPNIQSAVAAAAGITGA